MDKVLVVTGSRQIAEQLCGFVSQAGEYGIDTVSTGAAAAELADIEHFRAIIVCPPLPGESACAVACRIAQSTGTIVILIVKDPVSQTAAAQFEKCSFKPSAWFARCRAVSRVLQAKTTACGIKLTKSGLSTGQNAL